MSCPRVHLRQRLIIIPYGGGATAERGDYDGEAEESIRVSSGRNSFTVRISTNEDTDFDDETFYLYVTRIIQTPHRVMTMNP